jgi:hypothetical protein
VLVIQFYRKLVYSNKAYTNNKIKIKNQMDEFQPGPFTRKAFFCYKKYLNQSSSEVINSPILRAYEELGILTNSKQIDKFIQASEEHRAKHNETKAPGK